MFSGHSGGEAGCFSLIRVSHASATIHSVTGPTTEDEEAGARSRRGRMASATLRQPISCSSVAAATRPSRDLSDSSISCGSWISLPGVRGADGTGDGTRLTNTTLRSGPRATDTNPRPRPWAGPSPTGPPPQIGPTGPALVPRSGRTDRVGAHSNLSVPPSSGAPAAGTFGPPLVRHPVSFVSSSLLPPRRHGSTVVSGRDPYCEPTLFAPSPERKDVR